MNSGSSVSVERAGAVAGWRLAGQHVVEQETRKCRRPSRKTAPGIALAFAMVVEIAREEPGTSLEGRWSASVLRSLESGPAGDNK